MFHILVCFRLKLGRYPVVSPGPGRYVIDNQEFDDRTPTPPIIAGKVGELVAHVLRIYEPAANIERVEVVRAN